MSESPEQGLWDSSEFNRRATTFRQQLLKLAALVIAVSIFILGVVSVVLIRPTTYLVALGFTFFFSIIAAISAERDSRVPAFVMIYGSTTINGLAILIDSSAPWPIGLIVLALLLVIGGLLLGPQTCKNLGIVDTLIATLVLAKMIVFGESNSETYLYGFACLLLFPAVFLIMPLYTRQAFENLDVLHQRLQNMEILASELNQATAQLGAATDQISTMSQQHLEGAVHQSSAVKQIRQALESVTFSSRKIAKSAHRVFANADLTLTNNERVHEHVKDLSGHMQRITEALRKISEISNKSEVLALNAALEGTKAGAAGRGFSIVAKQMRQLAESVQQSVANINSLIDDIHTATKATSRSMEEATKLARATTEAAHEISIVSQQQRVATEHVARAMDDIGEITSQVSNGSEQTRSSTEDLADLAFRLNKLVAKFVDTKN